MDFTILFNKIYIFKIFIENPKKEEHVTQIISNHLLQLEGLHFSSSNKKNGNLVFI
jgi:hypothetical protein